MFFPCKSEKTENPSRGGCFFNGKGLTSHSKPNWVLPHYGGIYALSGLFSKCMFWFYEREGFKEEKRWLGISKCTVNVPSDNKQRTTKH